MTALLMLAACNGSDPLPTLAPTIDRPSEQELAETQTALAPAATDTPTITPTATATDTLVPTWTPEPTETVTLSAIRQTEVWISARRTDQAFTATAQVPPTGTDTPTATGTATNTPTITFTPSPTLPFGDSARPNRIVFTSDRAGSNDIWLMELDGSNPEPLELFPDADDFTASCSPRGDQFVFDSDRAGDREIYLGTFNGDAPRPLTDTDGENFGPVWSPLGDLIAFVSTRDGQNDIWVMDTGGGNVRALINVDGADTAPQWSPDGNQLYYASNRSGQFDIYRYDFTTEQDQLVLTSPDRDESMPALAFDMTSLGFIADLEAGDSSSGALWLSLPEGNPRAVVTAQGRVDGPAWIDYGKVLLSADLGGVTHIMLIDLERTEQTILTNLGPRNRFPRPCYVQTEPESAPLPTGVPATPTPSATPELVTVYTAVVNPGADWQSDAVRWSRANLQVIAPNDFRLGGASFEIDGSLLIYEWTDAEENVHRLGLTLEAIDGALEASIITYSVNDLPEDAAPVQDLTFVIRENILLDSIPPGLYRLEDLEFADDGITFTFTIPPE
jgi:hypothetical protein